MDTHQLEKVCGNFFTIDSIGTKTLEDAFSYTVTRGTRTLAVVAAIPPKEVVIEDSVIPEHITVLLDRAIGIRKSVPDFLSMDTKRTSRLSLHVERPVLFASYSLRNSENSDKLILDESFGHASIKVKQRYTYENFFEYPKVENFAKFLDQLLAERHHTHKRAFGSYQNTKDNNGIAPWIVRIVCDLFNQSCVQECKRNGIPYFAVSSDQKVIINSGYASFNKPLRDIFSFINSVNLYRFITEGTITYTVDYILSGIPKEFRP